jgi:protein arginine kinase activator
MLCDKCGKNPAVVHRITTINGKKRELHLCKECAMQEKGMLADDSFSINALLSSLLDMGTEAPIKIEKLEALKCSQCGQGFSEFRKTGKLGCDMCYAYFRDRLLPLLKKIQGNTQHSGKIPGRVGGDLRVRKEIASLQEELERAVRAEEYERAVELRDRIKSIKESSK